MKLTENNQKEIIDFITVIIDSREKATHIIECFDKYGVKWERKKLNSGDYSFRVPSIDKFELPELNFEDIICIERKMNANELSRNLSTHKERFEREFNRTEAKIILMVEDSTYEDIALGRYNSKLTAKQYLGLLHSFLDRNDVGVVFVSKNISALFIYNTFKYHLKNYLKNIK